MRAWWVFVYHLRYEAILAHRPCTTWVFDPDCAHPVDHACQRVPGIAQTAPSFVECLGRTRSVKALPRRVVPESGWIRLVRVSARGCTFSGYVHNHDAHELKDPVIAFKYPSFRSGKPSLDVKFAECTLHTRHTLLPDHSRLRLSRTKSFCKGSIVKRKGSVSIRSEISSRILPERSYGRDTRSSGKVSNASHGIPRVVANSLTPEAIDILSGVLEDRKQNEALVNALTPYEIPPTKPEGTASAHEGK